jgi:hypothetical protein
MLCKPWSVSSCWPGKANNQATKKDGLGTWSSPAGLVRQSARAGESVAQATPACSRSSGAGHDGGLLRCASATTVTEQRLDGRADKTLSKHRKGWAFMVLTGGLGAGRSCGAETRLRRSGLRAPAWRGWRRGSRLWCRGSFPAVVSRGTKARFRRGRRHGSERWRLWLRKVLTGGLSSQGDGEVNRGTVTVASRRRRKRRFGDAAWRGCGVRGVARTVAEACRGRPGGDVRR